MLYKLAATQNFSMQRIEDYSRSLPSTCIFNDVTVGNNAVPGNPGFGTSGAKYQSTAAYDLATGLGSVNVANLVSKWNTATFRATTTTLALQSNHLDRAWFQRERKHRSRTGQRYGRAHW